VAVGEWGCLRGGRSLPPCRKRVKTSINQIFHGAMEKKEVGFPRWFAVEETRADEKEKEQGYARPSEGKRKSLRGVYDIKSALFVTVRRGG